MTSSNENIFGVTGPLWGEFIVKRWIPLKPSDAELWYFLWSASEQTVEQIIDADALRRHRAHYDVTPMHTCVEHIDGLVQVRRNSSVFLELSHRYVIPTYRPNELFAYPKINYPAFFIYKTFADHACHFCTFTRTVTGSLRNDLYIIASYITNRIQFKVTTHKSSKFHPI